MTYFRLFYHLVWTTRYRAPLITESNRTVIFAAITAKTNTLDGTLLEINTMPDHVHIMVTIPPKIAISRFVAQIKGSASYAATHQTEADDYFGWQNEYGILSVSESHVPTVIDYVRRQQEHHAANRLHPKMEIFTGDQDKAQND